MKLDALAIGAHADDVELGCGGTVALLASFGRKVGILHLTRGEAGTRGTPEEIAAATRTLIERVGPGGGVVIGSGNTVAKYVPLANYKAMLGAIRQYGAIY